MVLNVRNLALNEKTSQMYKGLVSMIARLVFAKYTSNGDMYFGTSFGSFFKILWFSASLFA